MHIYIFASMYTYTHTHIYIYMRVCAYYVTVGNTNWTGTLSTINLLTKVACFVKNWIVIAISKAADLNGLAQGGQSYLAVPFSKGSLNSGVQQHLQSVARKLHF